MNSSTRDQIFAAKEKLQQLTERAREEESKKQTQDERDKSQAQDRAQEEARAAHQQNKEKIRVEREKARQQARAREEEEYLKKHNKTVKQVLSQAARLANDDSEAASSENDGSDEEDEDDEDDEDNESDLGDGLERQHPRKAEGSGLRELKDGNGRRRGELLGKLYRFIGLSSLSKDSPLFFERRCWKLFGRDNKSEVRNNSVQAA